MPIFLIKHSFTSPDCAYIVQNHYAYIVYIYVVQLVENIRGSNKSSAQSHTSTHSSGAKIGLSKDGWRVRIRQAWLTGLLERSMQVGKGHNLMGRMVFNTFQLTPKGHSYLLSPHSVTLPPAAAMTRSSAAKQTSGEDLNWHTVYMFVHVRILHS